MRADGSNPVGFFIAKNGILWAIWAVLRVRMVKLYVRIAKMALGWQKMPFRGVRWGLGASHTSAPITLTWSGRRLRVFFIVSRGGSRHPLHVSSTEELQLFCG